MGALQDLNRLRKEAKELGITEPHKMKKAELETRIAEKTELRQVRDSIVDIEAEEEELGLDLGMDDEDVAAVVEHINERRPGRRTPIVPKPYRPRPAPTAYRPPARRPR